MTQLQHAIAGQNYCRNEVREGGREGGREEGGMENETQEKYIMVVKLKALKLMVLKEPFLDFQVSLNMHLPLLFFSSTLQAHVAAMLYLTVTTHNIALFSICS